jgi:5'-nucleotidase
MRRYRTTVRILVTNDDGIEAPGLSHLARALTDAGYDVFVAAPLDEASGAGAGVGPLHTMGKGIDVRPVTLAGLEGIETIGVDALPALIVLGACLGAFGPAPDLIVTGINPGRNVGRAVLHSGTVGAALTGVHFQKRGLAMSIQSGPFSAFEASGRGHIHFETAAAIAAGIVGWLAEAPPRTVINCNVPNLPLEALKGVKRAPLSPSGLVRSAVVDDESGTRMQLEMGFGEPLPGDLSDEALTTTGWAAVTPLASVSEDLRVDVAEAVGAMLADLAETLQLGALGGARCEGPAA